MSRFPADRTEIQLAQIATIVTSAVGGKSSMQDFIITDSGRKNATSNTSISDASADAINRFAGVK